MALPPRVDAATVRERVQSGRALLVCAYEDEAKCARNDLEGSIPLARLRERLPTLPKEQEMYVYCA